MGVNIQRNIEITKCCYQWSICAPNTEKIAHINSFKNDNNDNINNINTFEDKNKPNIIYQDFENNSSKKKLKKMFLEKYISSNTKSSNSDLITLKIIYIQSYIRGFLLRKKVLNQKIIFDKLNNTKTIKEKDSEEEELLEKEDTLVISLSMNGTIFTGENSFNSSISINTKLNKFNLNERFIINKNILSFNLKSKNNIKYKYFGFLKIKNNNKQNYISSSGVVKNSMINDIKMKNGFGKLIFDDNSIFKCYFNDNKANGIGQYIDKINNEEYIGEYKNNTPIGYGIYSNITHERKCMGYFKINGINGIGIEESIEDGYIYYGEFDKNQKNGYGVLRWKEGIKYEGYFLKNQMNGYAIIEYPDNKLFKGQINNGKMEGFGEFNWGREKKYLGYYKNDKRSGFGIFLWNINKIKNNNLNDLSDIKGYIGFWSDGNMNGVGLKISEGKIKLGVWKNGIKMEWLEEEKHLLKHIQSHQKKYLKILLGKKQKIINLLNICLLNDDNEDLSEEEEFELN